MRCIYVTFSQVQKYLDSDCVYDFAFIHHYTFHSWISIGLCMYMCTYGAFFSSFLSFKKKNHLEAILMVLLSFI